MRLNRPTGLKEFNNNLRGLIRVIDVYFGEDYQGYIPAECSLKNKNAREQLLVLAGIYGYNGMDFHYEINANNKAIYLNIMFWSKMEYTESELFGHSKSEIINAIQKVFINAFKNRPLPSLVK